MAFDYWERLGDGDGPAELGGEGGDSGILDAARHNAVEVGQITVAVECEAMHCDSPGGPDPDGGNLAGRAAGVGRQPDPAAALHSGRGQVEVSTYVEEQLLYSAHVRDYVAWSSSFAGQTQDRVPDQLAGAM